ncbi:MAG: dihydrodipicolinate synthase family protein [Mariniphaga sp.]|nr:dihydrodipicolinate synthase family protein [Mariniphaga sp.]
MKNRLIGIFAPINIPFDRNEEVDFDGLTDNLHFYLNTELSGLLLLGSNSEYKSLSEDEKIKILEIASNLIVGKKTIIVGLMYESLYLAKKFIENVSHLQIDYLLVQPPFYFRGKFTEEDYYHYYTDLAKITPFPIMIYNAPGFTGIDFSEQLINRIAELDQVIGIKDSSKLKKNLSSKLSVLTGTVNTLYEMLETNAVGGVVSLANFLPGLPVRIYNEFINGNKEKAKVLQEIAIKINKSVSGKSGVSGVKAAMDAMGLTGGESRKPLQKLSPAEVEDIRDLIKECYPDGQ